MHIHADDNSRFITSVFEHRGIWPKRRRVASIEQRMQTPKKTKSSCSVLTTFHDNTYRFVKRVWSDTLPGLEICLENIFNFVHLFFEDKGAGKRGGRVRSLEESYGMKTKERKYGHYTWERTGD